MNWASNFPIANLAILLVPVGYALIVGGAGARAGRTAGLFALAVATTAAAFLLSGHAVLRATDAATPLSLDADFLFGRLFDGTAVHTMLALTVGSAVIAAAAAGAVAPVPAWAVALAGLAYGGAIGPLAAHQGWWGLLRSSGLTDTCGALPLHLCAATVAAALVTVAGRSGGRPLSDNASNARPAVAVGIAGFVVAAAGLVAATATTTLMQSPTTISSAVANLMLGGAAGGLVGGLWGVLAGRTRSVGGWVDRIFPAAVAGAVATSAGAGRLPWWLAVAAGAVSAALAAAAGGGLARLLSLRPVAGGLLAAHALGGAVALAAVLPPSAGDADTLRQRAVVQVVSAGALVALTACLAIIVFLLGRAVLGLLTPATADPDVAYSTPDDRR